MQVYHFHDIIISNLCQNRKHKEKTGEFNHIKTKIEIWNLKNSFISFVLRGCHFHFALSCIGEGNGNPLQCSCLENPRDGGAWWAAVHGVPHGQTRLKWLSSSNCKRFEKRNKKTKRQLYQWKKEQKAQIPNPQRGPYEKTFMPTENRKEMIYFHGNGMIYLFILYYWQRLKIATLVGVKGKGYSHSML